MLSRRSFIRGTVAAATAAAVAPHGKTEVPQPIAPSKARRTELNAYYLRAHMYTIVPRHVREDLDWMAAIGTRYVSVAVLEQDLSAAVENHLFICNEAAKRGMKVLAVPSRWAGLVAGAPKVPSLFTILHPETWMLGKDGRPQQEPGTSGALSSIHAPATLEFFTRTLDQMFARLPFDGMIIDEPKAFREDYSAFARKALGDHAPREAHLRATAGFFSQVARHVKAKHPGKLTALFYYASSGEPELQALATLEGFDAFGCDGRPWGPREDAAFALEGGGNESGKGKTLLPNLERFSRVAEKMGARSFALMENHNLTAPMIDAMARGLPQVVAQAPSLFSYYYYPRNVADPDRAMNIVRENLIRLQS